MQLKKILCPIDFSQGSLHAMHVAVRMANESDAELDLVHVCYPPAASIGGVPPRTPEAFEQLADDAERALESALAQAKEVGATRVNARLLTGIPGDTLVEEAADPAIDVIVIGTEGRTGIARALLGSVADQVIRHAPCSVLAVRGDSEPRPFDHVLCPTDFTDSSRYALELACTLATRGGAGITLLHVVPSPVTGQPSGPHSDLGRSAARLDTWTSELGPNISVPIATRTRVGFAGSETLAVLAEDRTFDLVVMGSHDRGGIKRVLIGSVAEKVVRHARCPVLVARRRGSS